MSESEFMRALKESFEEDCDKLMSEEIPNYETSAKFEKKMQKLIKSQRKPYFKLISTGGRRAACIIAAVVVLSVSSLSVKAVRKTVLEFILNPVSDGEAEITTSVYGVDNYPNTIEEEYYISEIPEGFECDLYDKCEAWVDYSYTNDEGDYIVFRQEIKDVFGGVYDIEHSVFYEYTDDDGQKYLIHECGSQYSIIWENGKYIFIIGSNLDKEEILDLCRSIKIK